MNEYSVFSDPSYYRSEYRAASGDRIVLVAHLAGRDLHRVTRTEPVDGIYSAISYEDFDSREAAEAAAVALAGDL